MANVQEVKDGKVGKGDNVVVNIGTVEHGAGVCCAPEGLPGAARLQPQPAVAAPPSKSIEECGPGRMTKLATSDQKFVHVSLDLIHQFSASAQSIGTLPAQGPAILVSYPDIFCLCSRQSVILSLNDWNAVYGLMDSRFNQNAVDCNIINILNFMSNMKFPRDTMIEVVNKLLPGQDLKKYGCWSNLTVTIHTADVMEAIARVISAFPSTKERNEHIRRIDNICLLRAFVAIVYP